MEKVVNLDLLLSPLNWIIVFLILYFLALISQYVSTQLKAVGVSVL
jgi:hypothetical protein